MPACAVAICRNYTKTTKGTDVKYFSFPRDPHQQEEWVWRCGRETDFNISNSRICSEHFTKDDFERDLKNELLGLPVKRILKALALPTVNICYNARHRADHFNSSHILTEASDIEDAVAARNSEKQQLLTLDHYNEVEEKGKLLNNRRSAARNKQSMTKSGKLKKSGKQMCCENVKRRFTCIKKNRSLKLKKADVEEEEMNIGTCSSENNAFYLKYKRQCEKLKAENYKLKMCLKSLQIKFQNIENGEVPEITSSVNWEESYKALKISYDALQNKLKICKESDFQSLKEMESPKEFEISFSAPDFHQYALRYREKEVLNTNLNEESQKQCEIVINSKDYKEIIEKDDDQTVSEIRAEDMSLEQSIILIELPSGAMEASDGVLQPISFVDLNDIE